MPTHTFFCSTCSAPRATLRGDDGSRYCNNTCYKKENRLAPSFHMDVELYRIVAERLGYDIDVYTFEQFQDFMVNESSNYSSRSIQEWMEDWLEGFYTDDRARKETLRALFQQHNLRWSVDAYILYQAWSKNRDGNRYQKMTEFVKQCDIFF